MSFFERIKNTEKRPFHPASENFIRRLSFAAGGTASEQAAFRTWALQRLHCTSQRGVARIIRHRTPIHMGLRRVAPRGYRNLGFLPPPPCHALNSFSHQQSCFPVPVNIDDATVLPFVP